MAELKPCPFCGGTKLEIVCFADLNYVTCNTCGVDGPDADNKQEATEVWNERATDGGT